MAMHNLDRCGLCADLLRILCQTEGGQFCQLRERYATDPSYSSDQVLYDVTRLASPEQLRRARERLVREGYRLVHRV